MPLDQQPIGRQATMKRTGRDAVQIRMIFPANGAKPVQIEVRVAKFEGIKRPLNEPDSAAQGCRTLKKFQQAANATVAVFAVNTGHVRKEVRQAVAVERDRKSTRLNSSHGYISYAVFCLKKKKTSMNTRTLH